jgi:hypothetical protein
MRKVAEAIASYWQPIKTWTQIALTISQNGQTLTAATLTLLAITIAYQKLQNRREKKSNIKLYDKLSEQHKQVIQAAQLASKKNEPTINAIASHYKMLTGRNINIEELTKKIGEIEKVGLIKKEINNYGDQPRLIWKTKLD